jgi:hypothetical protein
MDRKKCVLFYSKASPESSKLINYISQLPIDLPTILGMSIICIDNDEFKAVLQYNNIHHVPTVVIQYYDDSKQKLQNSSIYTWINNIISELQPIKAEAPKTISTDAHRTVIKTPQSDVSQKDKQETSDESAKLGGTRKKPDITALAMEMQKRRETDLADIKEQQKPI